jgi:hypothetical protein
MPELNPPNPQPRRNRKSTPPSTLQTPERLEQTDQQRDASPDISSEEIARRAYERWEGSDRSDGRDQEHWFAAEEDLRRSRGGKPARRPRQGEDMGLSELDEIG